MLRTLAPQQSLWAAVLPEVARGLPAALAELDTYLDDPVLFEPFRPYFHPSQGRPGLAGNVRADDGAQVPLPPGLRDAVCRGLRFQLVVAVLQDPARGSRPPSLDARKGHFSLRRGGCRAPERGVVEKGGWQKAHKARKVQADTTVVPANGVHLRPGMLARGDARLAVLTSRLR